MPLTREEVNRKLLHGFSGTAVPAGILYLPLFPGSSPWLPAAVLFALLFGSLVLEFARFRVPVLQRLFYVCAGSMLRPEESRAMTGSTWLLLSAFICSVLFIDTPQVSFIVLNLFILGDAVAALVGIPFGRTRIGKKSLEGSAACFLLCLALLFGVYPLVPHVLDPWGGRMPLPVGLAAALCITVLELFPLSLTKKIAVNDNLLVPVVTGWIIRLLSTGVFG